MYPEHLVANFWRRLADQLRSFRAVDHAQLHAMSHALGQHILYGCWSAAAQPILLPRATFPPS
jgi:hypothetical protein